VPGFFGVVSKLSTGKRPEAALWESEERFRIAFDEVPVGMAVVGIDGRFLRVNRALCRIVGYTAEELAGLTFQSVTHPEDLNADLGLLEQLRRGEIPRYTLAKRYIRKDGSAAEVILGVDVVRAPDGSVRQYIGQIEDVSERNRLERESRLAEARSSGIISISADAIVSIDEEQRISLFNAGAETIFGHASEDVLGKPLDLLIPARFREAHRRYVQQFAAGPPTARRMADRSKQVCSLRRDGSEFSADAAISKIDVDGRAVLTATLRDVSEQKRIEREQSFLAEAGPLLAESLDYEQTLTRIGELAVREIADVCIIDIVSEDGKILRHSVTCREGCKQEVCDTLRAVDLERSRPHLMHAVLHEQRPVLLREPPQTLIASLAQGDEHLAALRAAEIRSMVGVPLIARGRLLGAIAFLSSSKSHLYDTADVRLAEELAQRAALAIENARLYRAAQQATRTRDDVLSVVAHDLRTPLQDILMRARLLSDTQGHPELRSRKPLEEGIERAVRRMDRMIRDLLDVASLDAGRLSLVRKRLSAANLVAGAVHAQMPVATAASLTLQLDAAADLPDIDADSDRLLQVFENLIGNAIKFTRPGGVITVGARREDGNVLFSIADTGPGIAAENVPRLFDRFWQATRSDRRGAGLGLPIAKGIIEAHGGRIWAKSMPGHGSTFLLTVPALV
jgi:PAS domain S-box-containing protein